MAGALDNIHPGLSQEEAIRLLLLPVEVLDSQSDPYMAAAHLINFPGQQTEEALMALVRDPEQAQPRRLARRKAVEVLGRLGCHAALPLIADILRRFCDILRHVATFGRHFATLSAPIAGQVSQVAWASPKHRKRMAWPSPKHPKQMAWASVIAPQVKSIPYVVWARPNCGASSR